MVVVTETVMETVMGQLVDQLADSVALADFQVVPGRETLVHCHYSSVS